MALVHDDDLACIYGDVCFSYLSMAPLPSLLQYPKTSQPVELMKHLWNSSPEIQVFQCGKSPISNSIVVAMASVLRDVHKDLLPANLNKRMPGAYRKIANVATLSKHSFDAFREGSSRSSSNESRSSSRAANSLLCHTSFTSYDGDPDLECDYTIILNNFLQAHPTKNLTPHFQYVMTREGRDDAPTHIATAKCEHYPTEYNYEAVY